jgi:hypothetical protein
VKRSLLLLPFIASACAVIGHERVEGWPELEIVEHRVPHTAMRDRCAPYAPPLSSPDACAEFHFATRTCHIWLSADFPPPPYIVEHEHLHCRGFDHIGSNGMRLAWQRYLSVQISRDVSSR